MTGRLARRAAVLLGLALLSAACSVNTPRHGHTALRTSGGGGATTEDGVTVDPATGEVVAEGGSAGAVGSGTGSAGATTGGTRATTSTTVGGTRGNRTGSGGTGTGSSGGSAGSTVGVTDNSVTITYTSIFSGANGSIGNLLYQGFQTWVDDVNARNGVHGRKVAVKRVDHKSSSAGAKEACDAAKSNGTLFTVNVVGTQGLYDCLDENAIPLFSTDVDEVRPWKHLHSLFLTTDRGRLVASYIKGPLGGSAKKIGVIHTTLERDAALADGFKRAAGDRNLNVVRTEPVQVGQASFTAELSRLQTAGAEVVAVFVSSEVIGVLRDAKAMQYSPQFIGAVWCIDEFSAAAPELFTGVYCIRGFPGSEQPSYAAYKQKAPQGSTTTWSTYGIGLSVEKVLAVAGRQLTRQSFEAAFRNVHDYDNGIIPPINRWQSGGIVGTYAQFPVTCCNPDTTWKSLGPAKEEF